MGRQTRLPVIFAVLMYVPIVWAQREQAAPPADSSVQASPLKPTPQVPAIDSAAEASPVHIGDGRKVFIAPHTAIHVELGRSIDSGTLKNGETVSGSLESMLPLTPRGSLPAGSQVQMSVVETLPAGRLYAAGEFSLQLERVGTIAVFTDTLTYRGKPGRKELPDSAPAVGTDAGLVAGAKLVFHVLAPASPASGPPGSSSDAPGSLTGVAVGSRPPQQSKQMTEPASDATPSQPR